MKELKEDPSMADTVSIGKRFGTNDYLLLAALAQNDGDVKSTLKSLTSFGATYSEEQVNMFKMMGMGGPEARAIEKFYIGGTIVNMYIVFCSPDPLIAQMNASRAQDAMKEYGLKIL